MQVKVGAIGVGQMAGGHLRNLAGFQDVELVAMCDILEKQATLRAEEFGATSYTDYKKMFDKEELDAVYICTPPFVHGEQERIACERKIPFFVEKPIAVHLEQAIEIHEAVERSSNITSVGYHWRYQGNVERAQVALKDEKIVGALGYWMGGMPEVGWWRVRTQSGGQHVEQTTHIFDLCRYLVGSEAIAIHGFAAQGSMTDIPNYDIDDLSVVNIRFANGAVANVTSACMLPALGRVKLEVFCRDVYVEVSGSSVSINRAGNTETSDDNLNGYLREDRVFIDAVKSGDASKIRSSYSDALKTFRITIAASDSFAQGKTMNL